MNGILPRPIFDSLSPVGSAYLESPAPVLLYGEHSSFLSSWPLMVHHSSPCLREESASFPVVRRQSSREHSRAVRHHAGSLRLRRSRAGLHARRQEHGVCFHFFPLSVGFDPTVSSAMGALTIEPSILCHRQDIPSISSYSASPDCQSLKKNPSRAHSMKYLWTELGAAYFSLGNAFHWQPVRRMKSIASKTVRGGIGFLPPPDLRAYSFEGSLDRCGRRGSARFQNSSDTSHDCIFATRHLHETRWERGSTC